MSIKRNQPVFLLQITDTMLKVLKWHPGHKDSLSCEALEIEHITDPKDNSQTQGKLNTLFKKLSYNHNPLIVSLPRNSATYRYLSIPARDPHEIEKMAGLQAANFLPYHSHELITGYQLIDTDKEGYSQINLVIVHKDVIEKILHIVGEFKPASITIELSTFGISNLFTLISKTQEKPVMVIDIDSHYAELAVVRQKKVLFSRYVKINHAAAYWEYAFIEEVNKTKAAYMREISEEAFEKIFLLGYDQSTPIVQKLLSGQNILAIEFLPYQTVITLPEAISLTLKNAQFSIASLIGLAIGPRVPSLNLIPGRIKTQRRDAAKKNEYSKIAIACLSILLMLWLATVKHLDNKALYLKRLNAELTRIEKEASPLENIEKRLGVLLKKSEKRISCLDALYSVNKAMPSEISLVTFGYDEDNQLILHGQSQLLSAVFDLLAQLERSPDFRDFSLKIRYATQRKVLSGEITDFEITGSKKK